MAGNVGSTLANHGPARAFAETSRNTTTRTPPGFGVSPAAVVVPRTISTFSLSRPPPGVIQTPKAPMALTISVAVGCLAATYLFLRFLLYAAQDVKEPSAILTRIPFLSRCNATEIIPGLQKQWWSISFAALAAADGISGH
ncbi:hypothetical protein B0H67DRAFT_648951 [Lasiosphaeris hirsuta]|uniref:Uncharacterized protein n=1 Tax=Lasiosphaeris hirsuta TaxID=260670 RepID=A0AA40DLT3_9PEZI|nr:hypothetical protein B0H67DRAFT_648951 [Lasiosphaeris hirsuta]